MGPGGREEDKTVRARGRLSGRNPEVGREHEGEKFFLWRGRQGKTNGWLIGELPV